ncbi:MAG: hypothetical protein PVJ63_08405 [Thioalkalispiraceae bacterium]|jgi:hypothetical protein
MKKLLSSMTLSLAILMLSAQVGYSQQEQVYGWELMTEQERAEHRTKMQSMKTKEERERYRLEHHKKMQQRAKQQGVTLPDMPGEQGKGMGDGMGKGTGKGMGNGKK